MDSIYFTIPLAIILGIIAGIINTLAGSGSAITLPLFVFLGLPATVANATNRVGIIFQGSVGTLLLKKNKVQTHNFNGMIFVSLIGSIIGTQIAIELNERIMNIVIGCVMFIILASLFFKPSEWLKEQSQKSHPVFKWLKIPFFFLIGLYCGLIQAGAGIFILTALVLGNGLNLIEANAIKIFLILIVNILSLIIFTLNAQVHWGWGLIVGISQGVGAWIAVKWMINFDKASLWIRRLIMVICFLAGIQFLFFN